MKRHHYKERQTGSVAIEFAVLFTLFFTLVYGILAYSLPLLLEISFRQLSSEAARAILKVDPAAKNYSELLSREVTLSINNSWLPAAWRTGGCQAPDSGHNWQPLPAFEGNPVFGHVADTEQGRLLHVCLQRYYNANGETSRRAIIPVIDLAGFRIPSLPVNDNGDTILRGAMITRL